VENSIVIRYKWTINESLTALRLHQGSTRAGRSFLLLKICGIVAIFAGIAVILQMGFHWAAVYMLILGVWLLAIPWSIRYANIANFAKRPDKDTEFEWQISPDRLAFKSAFSSGEMAWNMIVKALRTPMGFLFYTSDTRFYWLPARAFRDAEEIERLAQIAQSKVQRYEQLRKSKAANLPNDEVCIRLQPAEALALFKWLARVDKAKLSPIEGPEQRTMQLLEGQLEKQCPGLRQNDSPLVEEARQGIDKPH
jgi:hypothetical protein